MGQQVQYSGVSARLEAEVCESGSDGTASGRWRCPQCGHSGRDQQIGHVAIQVFVQNFAELVVLRIIIGFFDAAVWTGNIKLMVGWWPDSRRASIMGIILAAYSLAITADFAMASR